jgi:hypothetical protein
MGASISSRFGSDFNNSVPDLMIHRAWSSVNRPSLQKCCLRKARFGLLRFVPGAQNCSSVGGCIAGACTSSRQLDTFQEDWLCSLTFADSLLRAHLCAIFHGVQREINFRHRPLVHHSSLHWAVHISHLVRSRRHCSRGRKEGIRRE